MKEEINRELRRQFAHALGIILVPLSFVFGKFLIGIASFVVAFIVFLLAEHRNSNRGLSAISKKNAAKSVSPQGAIKSTLASIHNVFEKFERSGGNYRGAFFFYLASAVCLFLFPQQIAALSITVLALGDSFSTAVGIFGRNKIFYNPKKTWEGTLSGFIASFAGCFFISPYLALPAAFIGMFAESLPIKIDDNLTIPIMTGVVLSAIVTL